MKLAPKTVLQNRYVILRLLGEGGFGAVYEARDKRLGHRVALKQLVLGGQVVEQAFEREARILARLKHGALPKVSDYFVDSTGCFFVMEYIEGDDLGALLDQQSSSPPFTVELVLEWADQVLAALEYLHSRQPPVIHRDIKPSNLKLSPEGKVYLLNFGISKSGNMDTNQATSGEGEQAFSPHYASMEQIEGKGTDARSDLYSLGVTLHHLLTNQKPPKTVSHANTRLTNKPDLLRPVNELNSLVPVEVAQVLSSALNFDPNLRPQSTRAMRDMLKQAIHSPKKVSSSTSPPTEQVLFPELINYLLLVGIGIGIGILWQQHTEPLITTFTDSGTTLPISTREAINTIKPTVRPTPNTTSNRRLDRDQSIYAVQEGDTLARIAEDHGTTADQLRVLNDLTSDFIYVSQELIVPTNQDNAKSQPTTIPIENEASSTTPTQRPNSNQSIYIVAEDDTLLIIAENYSTTVDQLRALNNLTSNFIYVGQELVVP